MKVSFGNRDYMCQDLEDVITRKQYFPREQRRTTQAPTRGKDPSKMRDRPKGLNVAAYEKLTGRVSPNAAFVSLVHEINAEDPGGRLSCITPVGRM